jgi:hypothetical protein
MIAVKDEYLKACFTDSDVLLSMLLFNAWQDEPATTARVSEQTRNGQMKIWLQSGRKG